MKNFKKMSDEEFIEFVRNLISKDDTPLEEGIKQHEKLINIFSVINAFYHIHSSNKRKYIFHWFYIITLFYWKSIP